MKKIFLLSGIFCAALFAHAQDFHYSMFTMAPLTLNPGLTGNFTGDLRIVNNYRTQWSSISKPFTTYSFGGDMPFHKKSSSSPDFFAAGINVNVDKGGSSNYRSNGYYALGSYNKSFDGKGMTYFSLGLMAGLIQHSIGLSSASWDQQFNGMQYDPTLPSGETFSQNGGVTIQGDYSGGIAITSVANDRFKMNGGLFADHFSKPNVSFTSVNRQFVKFGAHYSAQVALGANSNAWLIPTLLYMRQGPAQMVNVGAGIKYELVQRSHYTGYHEEKTMTIGGMYRMGDAASFYVRVDIGSFGGAFNYDLNVSKLTVASKGMGALEFMLIYTGIFSDQNTRLSTPSFF